MNQWLFFMELLIGIGLTFLMISVWRAIQFLPRVETPVLRTRWLRQMGMMLFFCLGYVAVMAMAGFNWNFSYDLLVALIFLGGGFFVFFSVQNSISMLGVLQGDSLKLEKGMERKLRELERARHNILNTESTLQSFFDSSSQFMGVVEILNDDILHIKDNKASSQFFGHSADEMSNKLASDMGIPPETIDFWLKQYRQAMAQKKPVSFEYDHQTESAKNLTFSVTVNYIGQNSGGNHRFSYVVSDVTQRIAMERQLIEAKEEALDRAKKKSDFLATISHEIRTPMNGILGMCDLLLQSLDEENQRERVNIVKNCSNSLLELINDLLDLSKIEAGGLSLEAQTFDIRSMLKELISLFSVTADQKRINLLCHVDVNVPQYVVTDARRLRQIISNLLNNGIKFTEKGFVQLTCSYQESKQKDGLSFCIQDTGIGVPFETQSQLFSPFVQGSTSTSRLYGGTGLGLAVSKALCQKMGGDIWLESRPGVGSKFYFTLPVETKAILPEADILELKREAKETQKLADSYPYKILIAEDNRTNQMVLAGLLKQLGYVADIARDGKEAVAKAKEADYNLIFMDCHMPEMDGFEATEIILREVVPKPRIIAVTASSMEEEIKRCLSCGMEAVVSKPISRPPIVEVLSRREKERVHLKIFDEKEFLSRFEGMEDLAAVTLEDFLAGLPKLIDQLKMAIEKQDEKALHLSAHTFKGTASNFFAEKLCENLKHLEQMGKSRVESWEDIKVRFDEVENQVDELRLKLKGLTLKGAS